MPKGPNQSGRLTSSAVQGQEHIRGSVMGTLECRPSRREKCDRPLASVAAGASVRPLEREPFGRDRRDRRGPDDPPKRVVRDTAWVATSRQEYRSIVVRGL